MKIVEVKTNHYAAKTFNELKEVTHRYISDVEKVWDTMVSVFGKQPAIDKYFVDFTVDSGVCYLGDGKIKIYSSELEKLPSYPEDLTWGLTFETFHGYLEHVKHRPNGVNGRPYYGENKLGESFSTILKIELLDRIELTDEANKFRAGKGMGESHHQLLFLLVELHKKYGIELFQKFFRLLESHEKPVITKVMPKDELCQYLSECAGEDLTNYFQKAGLLEN